MLCICGGGLPALPNPRHPRNLRINRFQKRTTISSIPQNQDGLLPVGSIAAQGSATVLKADKPDDTNSIQEPKKIVPVAGNVGGLGTDFTRDFPPYSITILELRAK